MTGKPFLYKFGLVDAVIIEDDIDLPGRVKANDMVEKFDEFSSPFPVKDPVYPLACMDIQGPEYAPLLVGSWCLNTDLLTFLHPHCPYGR